MPRLLWPFTLAVLAAARSELPTACSAAPTCEDAEDACEDAEDTCDYVQDTSSLLQAAATGPNRKKSAPSFASFVRHHDRSYKKGTAEYEYRRSIYERRTDEVELLNARPAKLWTAGVNRLTDWTYEELGHIRGWNGAAGSQRGMQGAAVSSHGGSMSFMQTDAVTLPEQVSWAHLKASNTFHDQGYCGSCWAMASSLMLEANHEIHRNTSRTFSAQELVDCVPNSHHCGGTGGCEGNTVELALDFAMKHGLEDNIHDPYVGSFGTCSRDMSLIANAGDTDSDHFNELISPGMHSASDSAKGPSAFGLIGWERLPENKYEPLMRAVVERGPVAVSVFAEPWSSYMTGIFDDCDSDAVIDHAVVLIGYGKDDGLKEKFWLIQNSWGRYWGEDGRIRILRRDSEETLCGTDSQPEAGTACEGGPKEVTVCGMCGILYDTVVPHFSKAD